MATQTNIRPIQGIFFIVSLILLFLYINNPLAQIKEIASLGLFFLISGVLFLVITMQTPVLQSLTVKGPREFFAEASIGMGMGVVTTVALNLFLAAGAGVRNMTASIAPLSIQQMGITQILVITELMPLLETTILVGGTIVIASFIKGVIPFPKIVAGLMTALGFASFHFNAIAGGAFEYSLNGFLAFVTSTGGAFPALVMGMMWIVLFLVFDSFVLIWMAHRVVNMFAMAGTLGWNNEVIMMTLILDVGIIVITYYKIPKMFWHKFNDFDLKRLSYG